MNKNLGDFAIGHNAFEAIKKTAKKTVLELGSGTGSIEIAKHFNLYSIEDQVHWVERYQGGKVFHVPIVNDWYDVKKLESIVESINYDLILVDGPFRYSRNAFFDNYHLFKKVPFMIDDTHRDREMDLVRLFEAEGFKFVEIKEHNKSAHLWLG